MVIGKHLLFQQRAIRIEDHFVDIAEMLPSAAGRRDQSRPFAVRYAPRRRGGRPQGADEAGMMPV